MILKNIIKQLERRSCFIIISKFRGKVIEGEPLYYYEEDIDKRLKYLNSNKFLGKEEVTKMRIYVMFEPYFKKLKGDLIKK